MSSNREKGGEVANMNKVKKLLETIMEIDILAVRLFFIFFNLNLIQRSL